MKKEALLVVSLIVLSLFFTQTAIGQEEKLKVPFGAIKPSCYGEIDSSKAEFALSEVGEECVVGEWLEEHQVSAEEEKQTSEEEKEEITVSQSAEFEKVKDRTYKHIPTSTLVIFKEEERMFPASWYEDPVNAEAGDLDFTEVRRSLRVTEKFLKKYPTRVVRENLEAIYVLGELEFYGQGYGGTNSSSRIYIKNRGVQNGYTDDFLERVFHEEFSSVLLKNYRAYFDEYEWKQVNPDGFNYGKGGMEALKADKDSEKLSSELAKEGFLNQYATSSVMNDFNPFAKRLFEGSSLFWELVDRYPKIQAKGKIVIDFYHRLDPQFTQEYFRSLE